MNPIKPSLAPVRRLIGSGRSGVRLLVIAAPAGPTRERLRAYFAPRAERVVSIAREQLGRQQQIAIEDERVLVDGEDLLGAGTAGAAALITDSLLMWPLPLCDPTLAEWQEHVGRLDDFLRDERESRSLYLSLIEILNEQLEICINPQAAFEHAATKPLAFEMLARAGVPVPPLVTTNDPEAVAAFAAEHGGTLCAVDLGTGEPARWLAPDDVGGLELARAPVMLQALDGCDEIRLMAIGGRAVASRPTGPVPEGLHALLGPIQQALRMPWAELTFRRAAGALALGDFSPRPDLGALGEAEQERVLAALGELVERER